MVEHYETTDVPSRGSRASVVGGGRGDFTSSSTIADATTTATATTVTAAAAADDTTTTSTTRMGFTRENSKSSEQCSDLMEEEDHSGYERCTRL